MADALSPDWCRIFLELLPDEPHQDILELKETVEDLLLLAAILY